VTSFAGKPCRSALVPEYKRFDRLSELSCDVPDLRCCSVAIVTNHLLSLIGNVRINSSQPLQHIEHPGSVLFFGLVFYLADFPMVGHPFPGERCANKIPGRILHGFFIPWQSARPGEYVKSGVPPFIQK